MSFFGSLTGSDAIKDAAKEQRKATQAAIRAQQQAGDQAVGLYSPYRDVGMTALHRLAAYAGLSGRGAQQEAYDDYLESPDVEFRKRMGIQAIDRSRAAVGGLRSGRTIADLAEFGQGLASQGINDLFSRITDLKDTGYGATAASANARLGVGGNVANLLQQGGNAQAELAYRRGQIIPNLLTGVASIGGDIFGRWLEGRRRNPYAGSSSYEEP